jgi:hypothetical protein
MPYAAIGLVLPGGSVIALLLWLYQRHGIRPLGGRLAAAGATVFRRLEDNERSRR